MRVFPVIWTVLTIPLGLAVFIATWMDAVVEMGWFDDTDWADNINIFPEPILVSIGLLLMIFGGIATAVMVIRFNKGADNRQAIAGLPRVWTMISTGLGAAVIAAAYLEGVARDVFFSRHGMPDPISSVPTVILACLGGVLIVGGIMATDIPRRRRVAGGLASTSAPR